MADVDVVDEPVLDLPKKKKKKAKAEEEAEVAVEEPALELPSKKKKKKKVKAEGEGEEDAEGASAVAEEAAALFEATKKTKKKKAKVADPEEVADSLDNLNIDDETEELIEMLKKKKKSSKGKASASTDEADADKEGDEDAHADETDDAAGIINDEEADDSIEFGDEEGETWLGSDRDYRYTELLHRVFSLLRAKNPELSEGRRKYKMKPPQVMRDGTRKTVFVNFAEICKSMNRNPEHVLAFAFAELGTSGSVDGNERLVIKGRFLPKSIETILRRYISEYVVCSMCRSLDTVLTRDPNTRLFALQCSNCGANRTVSGIKTGYQAQVGKRKKTE